MQVCAVCQLGQLALTLLARQLEQSRTSGRSESTGASSSRKIRFSRAVEEGRQARVLGLGSPEMPRRHAHVCACSRACVLKCMFAHVYVCSRVYGRAVASAPQERSFVEALQNWNSEKIIDLYVAAEAATEGAAEAMAGEAGQVCRLSALTQQPGRNRPGNEGVGIPLHLRLPAALSNQPLEHASKRRTVQGCLSKACGCLSNGCLPRNCCLPPNCCLMPVQLQTAAHAQPSLPWAVCYRLCRVACHRRAVPTVPSSCAVLPPTAAREGAGLGSGRAEFRARVSVERVACVGRAGGGCQVRVPCVAGTEKA